jgi:F-type H+-transporting ATPase subunit b
LELNWSTYFLEIINFLILVWILKHFFYAPVMNVIERRRKSIEDSLTKAQDMRDEAKQMEEQYQTRLAQWEEEKKQARETMHKEVNEERARLMEAIHTSIDKEREKAKVLEDRRLSEEQRNKELQALTQAAQFTSKLLNHLAGPELEQKLCQMLLQELPNLPEERSETLRNVFAAEEAPSGLQAPVKVSSAYAMDEQCRNDIQAAITELVGKSIQCEFVRDAQLIAGLRINLGPLVLRANLHDELNLFVESAHGSS